MTARVSRREFLRGAGAATGALVVGFSLTRWLFGSRVRAAAEVAPGTGEPPAGSGGLPADLIRNPDVDAWLRVDRDGSVTLFTGKAEYGQGILAALAQVAADELDVPFERVRVVQADTARSPDEWYTADSVSLETAGTAVRCAAAEARRFLLDRASRRLGVPPDRLEVRDGTVGVPGGTGRVTYGELVGGGLFRLRVASPPPVKAPGEYRVVGRAVPRPDLPAKVTASAPAFVHDLRLPGMLHGRVLRPPRPGARLASLEDWDVRQLPGVVAVVRDGSWVGVVAEREEQAVRALDWLRDRASWTGGPPLPDPARLYETVRSLPASDVTVARSGSVDAALGAAARRLTATYTRPYTAHASLGPSCAVALLRDGQLTVWSHTQGVFPLRRALAALLGMAESRVRVVYVDGPGGFGHTGADDAAADAALLARALPGRPVRVQWMRQDEFTSEPYGSAMVMDLEGGLGADGGVVAWRSEIWTASHWGRADGQPGELLPAQYLATAYAPPQPPPVGGERNADPPYAFPARGVTVHYFPSPLRVSNLRTMGAFANGFAAESFMDELAAAAGADPVQFRLRHLVDARAAAVIRAAADRFGWTPGRAPTGRGRGFAYARYGKGHAHVAAAVQAEVDRSTGAVRVARVVVAVDAGLVVNPDGLRHQVEGGVTQAVGWTLREELRFDRTGVQAIDWRWYPVLGFAEAPAVEVAILDRPDAPSLGVGEAGCVPVGAAVANAVFDATGARLRHLPLRPDRVKAALG